MDAARTGAAVASTVAALWSEERGLRGISRRQMKPGESADRTGAAAASTAADPCPLAKCPAGRARDGGPQAASTHVPPGVAVAPAPGPSGARMARWRRLGPVWARRAGRRGSPRPSPRGRVRRVGVGPGPQGLGEPVGVVARGGAHRAHAARGRRLGSAWARQQPTADEAQGERRARRRGSSLHGSSSVERGARSPRQMKLG